MTELGRLQTLLGLTFFVALLPLIAIVPYWFPPTTGVASEAAAQGYNSGAAYYAMALWATACIATFALLGRSRRTSQPPVEAQTTAIAVPTSRPISKLDALELFIVFAIPFVIYFPWALARHGTYIEDNYLLTALYRMQGGQVPYLDFEFPYGPLMIYLAHGWTRLVGYSMATYYTLIALLIGLQNLILIRVLQRFFPGFIIRFSVFLLISALMFDTLLSLSYGGIRRLLPVCIFGIVAANPTSRKTLLGASVLLGLLLAFSHDVGAICLLSVMALFGFTAIAERSWQPVKSAFLLAAVSVATWFVCVLSLLGKAFPMYLASSTTVLRRASAGEIGFAFHWTLNSLAVFALVCVACIIVGRGLGKLGTQTPTAGDRLFFVGLVYALLGMKSGLNRADLWHLASPMFALVIAFVLPYPKLLFVSSRRVQLVTFTLLGIMAVTYFAGLLPTGSYYARGLFMGFRDLATSRQRIDPSSFVSRAPSIETERTNPDPAVIELAAYLADKSRIDKPVVFYGVLWSIDKRVGVYRKTYPTDDFLLTDEIGDGVTAFIRRERAIVVVDGSTYERLYSGTNVTVVKRFAEETPAKAILRWLSSVHYSAVLSEADAKDERWDRTVGSYLKSNYYRTADFGNFVVLEPGTR